MQFKVLELGDDLLFLSCYCRNSIFALVFNLVELKKLKISIFPFNFPSKELSRKGERIFFMWPIVDSSI